ncbi:hypothetical protein B0T26DRAFT_205648 [Lasiosphaeria miniovina]|uniref:Uncharacterized protein n=1 Tax=Lasiosphaeria miniovina TaxID=1954250 RepID=A0AA40E2W6_9PEZI|nr:uncharacterized protein B0T26DRAFT_205648 [Lasiosphaeria miniovina]KAK0722166.1 hypothetical protein B0T26DRAFT_205648 [Lasiosphaeria miniovina]
MFACMVRFTFRARGLGDLRNICSAARQRKPDAKLTKAKEPPSMPRGSSIIVLAWLLLLLLLLLLLGLVVAAGVDDGTLSRRHSMLHRQRWPSSRIPDHQQSLLSLFDDFCGPVTGPGSSSGSQMCIGAQSVRLGLCCRRRRRDRILAVAGGHLLQLVQHVLGRVPSVSFGQVAIPGLAVVVVVVVGEGPLHAVGMDAVGEEGVAPQLSWGDEVDEHVLGIGPLELC